MLLVNGSFNQCNEHHRPFLFIDSMGGTGTSEPVHVRGHDIFASIDHVTPPQHLLLLTRSAEEAKSLTFVPGQRRVEAAILAFPPHSCFYGMSISCCSLQGQFHPFSTVSGCFDPLTFLVFSITHSSDLVKVTLAPSHRGEVCAPETNAWHAFQHLTRRTGYILLLYQAFG